MNIDQPAVIARHKACGEDAHETGQHHKIRMKSIYRLGKRGIEAVAIRIVAMLDDGGGNAVRFGDIQPLGIRAIADHRRDPAGQLRFQQACMLLPRPEIRMTIDFIFKRLVSGLQCLDARYRTDDRLRSRRRAGCADDGVLPGGVELRQRRIRIVPCPRSPPCRCRS